MLQSSISWSGVLLLTCYEPVRFLGFMSRPLLARPRWNPRPRRAAPDPAAPQGPGSSPRSRGVVDAQGGPEAGAETREERADPAGARGDGIRLGQLLKLRGIVATGGEAKLLIASAGVRVNGEVDVRRGRRLRAGDRVEGEGWGLTVGEGA